MLSLASAQRLECDGLDVAFAFAARPKLRQAAALHTLRATLTRNSIPIPHPYNLLFRFFNLRRLVFTRCFRVCRVNPKLRRELQIFSQ